MDNNTTLAEIYDEEELPTSILTNAQREYYLGERTVSEGGERALKRRVRRRVTAACWDLHLLVRAWPPEEIENVMARAEDPPVPVAALASFLYAIQPEDLMIEADVRPDADADPDRDRRAVGTENHVATGIQQVIEYREGVEASVGVTIDVDRNVALDELAERDLSRLDRDRLDTLLYTGTIDREAYAEANERRLERVRGGG